MRDTKLTSLDSRFRPLAARLIEDAKTNGINLRIINTLRTAAEHKEDLANGVSWITKSMHEAQPPEGLSLAIDVCPFDYIVMKNWNPMGSYWLRVGEIGEALGLRWGGRWKKRDLGHFEWIKPAPQAQPDVRNEKPIT